MSDESKSIQNHMNWYKSVTTTQFVSNLRYLIDSRLETSPSCGQQPIEHDYQPRYTQIRD